MKILSNSKHYGTREMISEFAAESDTIRVASAFFTDTELIMEWIGSSKKVELIVSLRPPTNYYSLKRVQSKTGITMQFLGKKFHSKFFIFYSSGEPHACIIGSSNFTIGGLDTNIETNAILKGRKYLNEIDNHFSSLWEESYLLQPSDLNKYKPIFDKFMGKKEKIEKEQQEFENEILGERKNKKQKTRVRNEAKKYLAFWRIVDEVRDMVKDISDEEYPNIPVYITIDHFWHWIKVEWDRGNRRQIKDDKKEKVIQQLFRRYCKWDKSTGNHTTKMGEKSKNLFAKLLSSPDKIDNLRKADARKIYASLHSGKWRTKYFGADRRFVQENSLEKIKSSFKYLLYSNDEIDLRIHNLCFNDQYKLSQFKLSGSQELIGWVSPRKYPMRNNKANEALELLGYEIKV